MHYVSLIVEFLRGRPSFVFWAAALAQATLWTVIPSLFYSAPPGDVPILLAIGHEFRLGSHLGPPLAFWLGDIAFSIAGAFGVYLLAQACIVVGYWAVFTLGRSIVGTRHAVLAVLLMVGIAAFTVPSPDFGPAVLAIPLWALALLHYWRAAGKGERGFWFLLALDLGLLLLTSYVGLILIAMLVVFSLIMGRTRAAFMHPEPWIAIPLLLIVVFPHVAWLAASGALSVTALRASIMPDPALSPGLRLLSVIISVHLGLGVLVWLASGWPRHRKERAPEIDRNPPESFARAYIYFFALMPIATAVAVAVCYGRMASLERVGPLAVLSGLALVLLAGDRVLLYREQIMSYAWLGLLVLPPVLTALAIAILPWVFPTDLRVAQPANQMGRFFAENFQRRTGRPLAYVGGEPRLAALVALGAPSRPHVIFDYAPEQSPWASPAEVRAQGGVLVWPAPSGNAPPAEVKADFPDLVPEVPRAFSRRIEGFLPLVRIGWAVVRPQGQGANASNQ